MYPTIEIQINQKLFKKRPKMVNEGPYATFHWPTTDQRLTKDWPSTLCHIISILMAWILFFGQIWLLFDTGPHYLSFFLQLYQISMYKIILFFCYSDVVTINKLQVLPVKMNGFDTRHRRCLSADGFGHMSRLEIPFAPMIIGNKFTTFIPSLTLPTYF